MQTKRGVFISVEGIEGVGKSTAIRFLKEYLTQQGVSVVLTREPGGTKIAEEIRAVLLGHHDEVMSPDTELLLMFAGRAQNLSEVIRPALQRGQWVISDRFVDASFAYQGGGRGIEIEPMRELANWVLKDLWPDMTLLLDAPVELGLQRVASRGALDRIEAEGKDFFQRVRDTYLALAEENPQRFRLIDATKDMVAVQRHLIECLQPFVELV